MATLTLTTLHEINVLHDALNARETELNRITAATTDAETRSLVQKERTQVHSLRAKLRAAVEGSVPDPREAREARFRALAKGVPTYLVANALSVATPGHDWRDCTKRYMGECFRHGTKPMASLEAADRILDHFEKALKRQVS